MKELTMETTTLEPRITNPAFAVPGAMDALNAVNKAISRVKLPERMLELMPLRASQINGCGVCAVQHPKIARRLGVGEERRVAPGRSEEHTLNSSHTIISY